MHGISVVPLVTGALVPVAADRVVSAVSVVPLVTGAVVPVVADTVVACVSVVPVVGVSVFRCFGCATRH